jgi:hypothetical protein
MLILVGILLGLQAAGFITGNIWGYLWGIFLLGAGLWLILSAYRAPKEYQPGQGTSIERKDAARASLRFDYGAGSLVVRGGARADKIIEGSSAAALEVGVSYVGDEAQVKVSGGVSWIPFLGPDEGAWIFLVNREIPIDIRVNAGASTAEFDMTGVMLKSIRFETGAMHIKLLLPDGAGETRVSLEGGATSYELVVPQNVAARVDIHQGASAVDVDESEFPPAGANRYESPDYGTASNRAEIVLASAAARTSIRRAATEASR